MKNSSILPLIVILIFPFFLAACSGFTVRYNLTPLPPEASESEPSALNDRLPDMKVQPGKIFPNSWEDLTPYRANLRTSEWKSLEEMAGAPQYRYRSDHR